MKRLKDRKNLSATFSIDLGQEQEVRSGRVITVGNISTTSQKTVDALSKTSRKHLSVASSDVFENGSVDSEPHSSQVNNAASRMNSLNKNKGSYDNDVCDGSSGQDNVSYDFSVKSGSNTMTQEGNNKSSNSNNNNNNNNVNTTTNNNNNTTTNNNNINNTTNNNNNNTTNNNNNNSRESSSTRRTELGGGLRSKGGRWGSRTSFKEFFHNFSLSNKHNDTHFSNSPNTFASNNNKNKKHNKNNNNDTSSIKSFGSFMKFKKFSLRRKKFAQSNSHFFDADTTTRPKRGFFRKRLSSKRSLQTPLLNPVPCKEEDKLNINTASVEALMTLPYITRVTARNIVAYRNNLGWRVVGGCWV